MTDNDLTLGERASMDHWLPKLEQLEEAPTPTTATIECELPEDADVLPIGVPPTDAVVSAIEAVVETTVRYEPDGDERLTFDFSHAAVDVGLEIDE